MSRGLLRLPETILADTADLDALAGLVGTLSKSWLVVLGAQRNGLGDPLDEFAVASAIVARDSSVRVGVATSVGGGRVHALVAREATTTQLLGACDVVLLEGDPAVCRDAARIVTALFQPGTHSMETPSGAIDGAVNDPVPSVTGGPPVLWREGSALRRLVDDVEASVGDVRDVAVPGPLPEPTENVLVVARHEVGSPTLLRTALRA
jgi:hypothetical protein